MLGLVLTAGGARGAYQAGVLKRIGEIPALGEKPSPFRIVAGASAGAINGSMLAAFSGNLREATALLGNLWSRLTVSDVFRPDLLSFAANGARLLLDLALGGLVGAGRVQSLLDTAPLRPFLESALPLEGIGDAIRHGHLYAIAVTATSYHSGRSFTFIQGRPGHPVWLKSRRVTLAVELTLDHICASAAIPIVFPPVRLPCEGRDLWFGDGGLRLVNPCSPAIRLGASSVLAVGVRSQGAASALSPAEQLAGAESEPTISHPPLAQICGVFLNAIFLDHLDADLDHLRRMNELLAAYHGEAPHELPLVRRGLHARARRHRLPRRGGAHRRARGVPARRRARGRDRAAAPRRGGDALTGVRHPTELRTRRIAPARPRARARPRPGVRGAAPCCGARRGRQS
ncbi:MAG: patatin-like phospholipase family protein [Candidatus Binatia bacterium]